MNREGLTRLTTMGDPIAARILAAQLEAAGFDVRLRGEFSGPLPMTVGRLAETEVWVPRSDLEEAQYFLDDLDEADPPQAPSRPFGPSSDPLRSLGWWLVAVLVLAAFLYVRVGSLL